MPTSTCDTDIDAVGLDRKVAFLERPPAYPEPITRVEAVETHMSWVFLADGFAYKLKKPVRFPYLDFSTVEARRQDCEEEVRLNRRLAPGVYLGTVPLTREAGGDLAMAGSGPVVDWLVKMRRLPQSGMLDHLLGKGAVPMDRIRELVLRLARFYATAPVIDWAPGAYVERLTRRVDEDAVELLRPAYGLPAARIRVIVAAQRDFLARAGEHFEQRVRAGRVVEGHGDLRPEHVCLEPGPVVIDCLEFKRDFRLLDAVDELAYLALECERLGDAALGRHILELYAAASGDTPDAQLVSFYKSHRACLRATLAARHLRDPVVTDPQKWLASARAYLDLAENYAARL